MKILFVPNPILHEGRPQRYIPLGILSLATILRNEGRNVEILDINGMSGDPTFREAPDAILAHDPDVIGFSAWCNMYSHLVKFAEIIRKKRPNVKILFGGVHATYTDVETIKAFPQIDIVVRGECDHTISDIVNSIYDVHALKQVPGLTFRDGDEMIRTPYSGPVQDLNDLPLPDYSLFPSIESVDCISLDVGRGCPFNCAYCVSNRMSKRKVRLRSVENVITVIKRLVSEHKKTNLRFEHDILTLNRRWLHHLCDELIRERLHVTWSCFARIDTVNEKTVDRMAAAGCSSIYFGIESGSPRMQKLLNKRLKLNKAVPMVRRACENGIEAVSGFITGFPQEKFGDLAATVRLMLELCLAGDRDTSRLDFWLLVPFPGSPLFEQYGDSLSLDERHSDFAVYPQTVVETDFIKDYPKIFSTLYHYQTEYLDRVTFVAAIYLMLNLTCLRYTSFMLLRDEQLGFPEKFLAQLSLLKLPADNIYRTAGTPSGLSSACDFIKKVLNKPDLEGHPIHDLMKFDLAWNDISFSKIYEKRIRIEEFSYDILELIKEAKSCRFSKVQTSIHRQNCSILFRKSAEKSVDAMKIPDLFKKSAEPT
jgi:radical SAM superfamily enzyme YgiQ (UPF0313 family)